MAQLVTVFGGDGFVGRYIVQALLQSGTRVRIASRNPKHGFYLKSQANLGQIGFASADITRPETLGAALEGADAAINLVGILNGDFDKVQRDGAANVAKAAASAGITNFMHMSAIGADADSASAYGRSKGQGEQAVLAALPSAMILRPSIIFGREDSFVNRFAGLIGMLPIVPVIGGDIKFQPIFVGDVAKVVAAVITNPAQTAGKTLELGGPEVISMEGLNRWIGKATGNDKMFVRVPNVVAAAMAKMTGWLPGAPMTWDQWLMLQNDNVVSADADGMKLLGFAPTSLEAVADGWLVIYRKHGRFGAKA
jgi:uncharacterized protein YbjT (DUF2867 family)